MDFTGSTVVITGGSKGIGRQIALTFARETEHALFLIARNDNELEKVKRECLQAGGSGVVVATCDLSDESDIEQLKFPGNLPDPGILINNAGTFLLKPLMETSPEEFEHQWLIHTKGPFLLTKKILPLMQNQERGLIVNIASLGALEGQARSGAYSSSKHALLGFSRSLRKELQSTNIAVTSINLGQTMSTSWEGIDVEPKELVNPADIGQLIVTLSRFSPRSVAEEITIRPQPGDRSPD